MFMNTAKVPNHCNTTRVHDPSCYQNINKQTNKQTNMNLTINIKVLKFLTQ